MYISESMAITSARMGDQAAWERLFAEYTKMIHRVGKKYYLPDYDKEDLYQEGWIGFMQAVQNYRADRTVSFAAFAQCCIERRMIDAVKKETSRKKNYGRHCIPLDMLRLQEERNLPVSENHWRNNPERMALLQELLAEWCRFIEANTSRLERLVAYARLMGATGRELAEQTSFSTRSIYHATERLNKKARKFTYAVEKK